MKEERFLKLTYIHDIATIVSIFLSVFHVMKGTGSKIRDVLCGSFLVMQIFAALKIGARFLEKKNDRRKGGYGLYAASVCVQQYEARAGKQGLSFCLWIPAGLYPPVPA